MVDLTKLFGQVEAARKKMEAIQKQMHQLRIEKETGAGMVKVVVNGEKKLLSIAIDKILLNDKDQIMLQDLIVSAVNLALAEADKVAQEAIQAQAMAL